mgnify:FL=1
MQIWIVSTILLLTLYFLVSEKLPIDVTASGKLFDGNVTIQAATPLTTATQWGDVPAMLLPARISMSDVSLSRVLSLVTTGTSRFDGKLAGDVELKRSGEVGMQSKADLELRTLTAGNRLLASLVSLEATTSGTEINLVSASGRYAGGQLQAEGRWSLGSGARLINFRLSRGRGDRVLLPISQQAETWFGGLVSGRGTIVGQASEPGSVRASGSVEVERGTAFGFPVGDAHSSFHGQFSAAPFRWNVSFPAISAALAKGRVKGSLEFASTSSRRSAYHMQSQWRAQHVDFENLLRTYVGTGTIGRGDITGEFELGGRNISGLRDLQGRYRVRLGGTDASAVPGLSAAGSLLGASSLAGVRFTGGESQGRIRKGDLLIESMTLSSEQATVTATGRVGLESRRMDVLAVLSTGDFEGQNDLLAASVSQIVLDQIPLVQINSLVSDRTLVVKFVGPTRDPIIQLQPAETLQVNARRFATQQLLGLVIADSIWNN